MRRVALAALLCVAAALGDALQGQVLWTITPPAPASRFFTTVATSPALVTSANDVYFNYGIVDPNHGNSVQGSSFCGAPLGQSTPTCVSAPTGATFYNPPVLATGVATNEDMAYSFSSNPSIDAAHNTSIAYIGVGVKPPTAGYRAVIGNSLEAVTPYTVPHQAITRDTVATGPSSSAVTIAINSFSSKEMITVWSRTYHINRKSGAIPSAASNVIFYEGFLFYLIQNSTDAWLYKMDPTAQPSDSAPPAYVLHNPCGFSPAMALLSLTLQTIDTNATGFQFQALMLYGANVAGQAGLCRISHRSGAMEWFAQVSGNVTAVTTISSSSGYVLVTGPAPGAAGTSAVISIDAAKGLVMWAQTRPSSDATSEPAINNGMVWYQTYGSLIAVRLADGVTAIETKFSCKFQPVFAGRRVYCVTTSDQLVAYTALTNDMMWSFDSTKARYAPLVAPNGNDVIIVRTDGSVIAVNVVPPMPPTTQAPAPSDDDNSTGVALAIVFSLLAVGGIAVGVFFFIKKRGLGFRRSALQEENIEAQTSPTPRAGAYGAVNE